MITSLLLATLSAPISWQQIEMDQLLELNAPLALSSKITLQSNTKMKVTDILPLDAIRVLSFKLKIMPCNAMMKKESSDMIIVDELYGAQLEKDCELNVYLELNDLSKPSLFNLMAR